jgi:hypothetical protein
MHATLCQAHVCEDAFWFLMEVQEVPIVEKKIPQANLAKRGVSAKHLQ